MISVLLNIQVNDQISKDQRFKGRTDSNSTTRSNEAVRVATIYYYSIYVLETKNSKMEGYSLTSCKEIICKQLKKS